jgi:hypothetical protein
MPNLAELKQTDCFEVLGIIFCPIIAYGRKLSKLDTYANICH